MKILYRRKISVKISGNEKRGAVYFLYMRPKDLPIFFKWEERRPMLYDGILAIPQYYEEHENWAIPSIEKIFGNGNSIQVEFCSGNGEWIAALANDNPHINWIAVECQFKRIRKIWSKKKNHSLDNLLIVSGKAEDFCHHYLTEESISNLYINFPDPWPKRRHADHRLIKAPFTNRLAQVTRSGGSALFVTDDGPYCEQIIEEMQKCPSWQPSFSDPFYVGEYEAYGESYFHRLWKKVGRKIRYIQFERR